jgi:hypothetical protein
MKGVVGLVIALAFIQLSLHLVGVNVVQQNLIFTHDSLKAGDIPFYDASLGEGTTKWYHYHWWEYASDSLRILPPLLSFMALTIGVHFKVKYVGVYVALTSLLLVIDLLKLFKRGVDFVRAGSFQLSRNFDIGEGESPSSANPVFITGAFLTLAAVIMDAIYLGLFSWIESSLEGYIEEQSEIKKLKMAQYRPMNLIDEEEDLRQYTQQRTSTQRNVSKKGDTTIRNSRSATKTSRNSRSQSPPRNRSRSSSRNHH